MPRLRRGMGPGGAVGDPTELTARLPLAFRARVALGLGRALVHETIQDRA